MTIMTTMVLGIIVQPGAGAAHFMSLKWQKSLPDDAQFIELPGFFILTPWQTLAGLYYTVRGLGLSERIRTQIFSAIHNRRHSLSDSEQVAAFYPGTSTSTIQAV